MFDVVNDPHQAEFTKLTIPNSPTHGIAGGVLDSGENGFTYCSLAFLGPTVNLELLGFLCQREQLF